MVIGYARVSTKEQNLDLQIDALKAVGCEKIYSEKKSTRKEREELDKMIEHCRPGDIVIVWKLDRIGRTTLELIKLIDFFNKNSIGFRSLNDTFIDTTTPNGKLIFTIFSALAEHEREIVRERTRAGLESARARGRFGGRPKGLNKTSQMKAHAAADLYNKKIPISDIMRTLDIGSKATLYRYLRIVGINIMGFTKVNSIKHL